MFCAISAHERFAEQQVPPKQTFGIWVCTTKHGFSGVLNRDTVPTVLVNNKYKNNALVCGVCRAGECARAAIWVPRRRVVRLGPFWAGSATRKRRGDRQPGVGKRPNRRLSQKIASLNQRDFLD